jgi:hypothetical protein
MTLLTMTLQVATRRAKLLPQPSDLLAATLCQGLLGAL